MSSSTQHKSPRSVWLKLAWLMGLAPLAAGLGIFGLWLLVRADWLEVAGVIVLYAGPVCIAGGVVFLIAHRRAVLSRAEADRRSLLWRTVAVATLYVGNFLAAGAVVYGVMLVTTCYRATIVNRGSVPLKDVRLTGGGVDVQVGDIPPNGSHTRRFWVETDGQLVLTATRDGKPMEAVVDGYVTGNMGGDLTVEVDPSGNVVSPRSAPQAVD